MNPSNSRSGPLRFRLLIRNSRWSPHPAKRVSSTGQCIFLNMPSLLPRESTCTTSVLTAHVQRPSSFDHRVGFSISFTRLLISSLALRPAHLLFGNSRPQITPVPLPHATKAYGQLLGRDFNSLDTLLLLRTVRSFNIIFAECDVSFRIAIMPFHRSTVCPARLTWPTPPSPASTVAATAPARDNPSPYALRACR